MMSLQRWARLLLTSSGKDLITATVTGFIQGDAEVSSG